MPGHGILGERTGRGCAHVWVLDPIDGTEVVRHRQAAVRHLIALLRDGRPIVGVIDMPALDERWVGVEVRTTFNGRPVPSARVRRAGSCAWLCRPRRRCSSATRRPRSNGCDPAATPMSTARISTLMGLLARGRVDLVCEASLQPYDYCAAVPVVEGAGGVISTWEGQPLGLSSAAARAGGRRCPPAPRRARHLSGPMLAPWSRLWDTASLALAIRPRGVGPRSGDCSILLW